MPTDRRWSDADRELETAAAAVHQAYLDTCARLGWPVKPSNQVPYEELPEEAKELDRASVRAARDALTAAGWCPPADSGCAATTTDASGILACQLYPDRQHRCGLDHHRGQHRCLCDAEFILKGGTDA